MKMNWKKLLLCLGIPLAVGGLAALLSGGGMDAFEALNQLKNASDEAVLRGKSAEDLAPFLDRR